MKNLLVKNKRQFGFIIPVSFEELWHILHVRKTSKRVEPQRSNFQRSVSGAENHSRMKPKTSPNTNIWLKRNPQLPPNFLAPSFLQSWSLRPNCAFVSFKLKHNKISRARTAIPPRQGFQPIPPRSFFTNSTENATFIKQSVFEIFACRTPQSDRLQRWWQSGTTMNTARLIEEQG